MARRITSYAEFWPFYLGQHSHPANRALHLVGTGAGIALLLALGRAGYDLVTANAIKVIVVAALTAVALPVFAIQHQIVWPQALVLAAGFAAGGSLGARLATRGGDRLIRPVLGVAVVALAARMIGLL